MGPRLVAVLSVIGRLGGFTSVSLLILVGREVSHRFHFFSWSHSVHELAYTLLGSSGNFVKRFAGLSARHITVTLYAFGVSGVVLGLALARASVLSLWFCINVSLLMWFLDRSSTSCR